MPCASGGTRRCDQQQYCGSLQKRCLSVPSTAKAESAVGIPMIEAYCTNSSCRARVKPAVSLILVN